MRETAILAVQATREIRVADPLENLMEHLSRNQFEKRHQGGMG